MYIHSRMFAVESTGGIGGVTEQEDVRWFQNNMKNCC